METPSPSSNEQKLRLALIGVIVGAAWGGLLYAMITWGQISPGNYYAARDMTVLIVGVTICICLACVWLGRWFTQLDGRIHALTCAVALITAADVLWLTGRLNFSSMSHGELWCLVFALATFIFTTGFLARPKDKLFH